MSENILEALTRLFGLTTKQDGGATDVERDFVINYFTEQLDQDSVGKYTTLYDEVSGYPKAGPNRMSVKESVRILNYCQRINRELAQEQKIIILIKLLELIASNGKFTDTRREIIQTVSSSFNIDKKVYQTIESFVFEREIEKLDYKDILAVSSNGIANNIELKHMPLESFAGNIFFLSVQDVNLYFVKAISPEKVILNGFAMKPNQVYLYSNGSGIKTASGSALYYSDVVDIFLDNLRSTRISFTAKNLEFRFPNGVLGVRDITISEAQGKLLGIMGGSGAGKTTLLNVLAGIEKPSAGQILINAVDSVQEKKQIKGVIGYVAQDDLLIEELSVYQNLYYNAKLCFKQLSEKEIQDKVMEVLTSLGLDHIRDLRVGSVLDKKISGGQRKRLNIALELIREPGVMFVDEPTSGLSSRDSENVIDLLKELSIKGKIIFVVIHQPSLDIYKMFDKMIILDKGGYPVYYGDPMEAVPYFRRITNQVESDNVLNPEEIFNIMEAQVVNEYGQYTNKRKVSPEQWSQHYRANFADSIKEVPPIEEPPPSSLRVPNIFKQAWIFTVRDFLSKIGDRQYMLINLLQAPVLAFLLSFVIRFQNDQDGNYAFMFNDNIPAYILICIIIALFMGLTVSAEEIYGDRKIQKREKFLNLSRSSYLISKLVILFLLSAIQTLSFVLIGNAILEIKGELLTYWLVLFSVSCFANVLGLNISSTFNSVVTIYITIPLLLIPQMILSGMIFKYDKMNDVITQTGKVPLVADIMTSRWAFEAIAVNQFISNYYQEDHYELDKKRSVFIVKDKFWIPELEQRIGIAETYANSEDKTDSLKNEASDALMILKNEIGFETYFAKNLEEVNLNQDLTPDNFTQETADKLRAYLDKSRQDILDTTKKIDDKKNKILEDLEEHFEKDKAFEDYNEVKETYFNKELEGLVTRADLALSGGSLVEDGGWLIQRIDPIYHDPRRPSSFIDYRTHFLAPTKHFAGYLFSTYYYNVTVIWLLTLLLYITLYFDFFKALGSLPKKIKFKKQA